MTDLEQITEEKIQSIDWNKVLIRCSSLSCLFTEPQAKADKEAGLLSATAKKHLIDVYIKQIWDIEKDLDNKYINKGIECEEEAITMVSRLDKKFYTKNTERKSNEWICGHADIVDDELITDTKVSWSPFTFLPKLVEPLDKDYLYQAHGYMWLWDKQKARISYCLCTTPESIRNQEKYFLLRKMDVATEENPTFIKEWDKLEKTMVFDHIPLEHRVIHQLVDRDEEIIKKIPVKVAKAREFLSELYCQHMKI